MTATTIRVQMAQRKDTAAGWTAANPILLSGEIGYETDTKKFKIGNGSTAWNSLAYLPIPDGSGNLTITGNLEIGSTGSLTFEGSTADGFETTLAVTNPTADRTITLPDVTGTVVTTGDTGSVTSTMIANGTIVDADVSSTAEIAVSKLANGTANQVIVTDGTNVSWSDNLTLAGDLTVNGTTTTINTQDLLVEDKNIIIGNVATPSDVTADGGGITLKGATDKTINWVDATDAWTLSEHVNIASGKEYRIAGTKVLDATSLGSSVLITSANITDGTIVDGDISATAEIAVSKLADGAARQLLQTDAAGTGVEWASNIDIPGTLDVTGAATFDSSVAVTGTLTKSGSNVVTVGDTGTVTSTMILDGTILNADVNASAAIAGTKISPDFGSQNVTTTGTSTAASFIPTSSTAPTNGLYLSAANSVALSTGGAQRVTVDSSGRVGIGTGSPVSTVNIRKDSLGTGGVAESAITLTYSSTNYGQHFIDSNGVYNIYANTNGVAGGQIQLRADAALIFNTASNERARIDSSGRVGIGTSTPRGLTSISNNTVGSVVDSSLHFGYSAADFYGFRIVNSSNPGVTAAGLLKFQRGTTSAWSDALVIDDNGRVGIGTASPQTSARLHVYATGDFTNDSAPFTVGDSTAGGMRLFFGVNNTSQYGYLGSVQSGTAYRSLVLQPAGGNVGIGTTTVNRQLVLNDNTLACLALQNSTTGNATGDGFQIQLSGTDAYIWNYETAPIAFGTNNQERFRCDSSGRLLVGTSSVYSVPTGEGTLRSPGLQRAASSFADSTISSALFAAGAPDGGGTLSLSKSRTNSIGSEALLAANELTGAIYFSGSDGVKQVRAAQIQAYVDGTPGADDMPGRLVFSTTSDGQASPTPRLTITSTGQVRLAGAGITFNGDTATANELDDYEEGTFTPEFRDGATGTAAPGYSQRTGKYTKIGNLVTYYIFLNDVNTTGLTAGNEVYIAGLPFAAVNLQFRDVPSSVVCGAATPTTGSVSFRVTYNQSYGTLVNNTTTGAASFTVSQATSGQFDCWISGQYYVS